MKLLYLHPPLGVPVQRYLQLCTFLRHLPGQICLRHCRRFPCFNGDHSIARMSTWFNHPQAPHFPELPLNSRGSLEMLQAHFHQSTHIFSYLGTLRRYHQHVPDFSQTHLAHPLLPQPPDPHRGLHQSLCLPRGPHLLNRSGEPLVRHRLLEILLLALYLIYLLMYHKRLQRTLTSRSEIRTL